MYSFLTNREYRRMAECLGNSWLPEFGRSLPTNSLPPVFPCRPTSFKRRRCGIEEIRMVLIFLFLMLLVLTFGVVLYVLKPSTTEVAVEQHIASIQEKSEIGPAGVTILKH